ncbi:MAG: alkyl sulfatase dimerization domain-containing protein [bacterium]
MADLFALSEHIIDNGITDLPVNRINLQLSKLFENVAMEMAKMAGGALKLTRRAGDPAEKEELSLASHFVEAAKDADPGNLEVHVIRSMVYTILRKKARSLMSKGLYRSAAEASRTVINAGDESGLDDGKSIFIVAEDIPN